MFGAAPVDAMNPNKDVELVSPPDDGVSSLAWSPKGNYLCGTSWNSGVYVWEVSPAGQSAAKSMTKLEQPALCAAWHGDGDKIFAAGCDKKASMWNLATGQTVQARRARAAATAARGSKGEGAAAFGAGPAARCGEAAVFRWRWKKKGGLTPSLPPPNANRRRSARTTPPSATAPGCRA